MSRGGRGGDEKVTDILAESCRVLNISLHHREAQRAHWARGGGGVDYRRTSLFARVPVVTVTFGGVCPVARLGQQNIIMVGARHKRGRGNAFSSRPGSRVNAHIENMRRNAPLV